MRSYRTEIQIPADRYVGLQLPADLPEGRAFVTVIVAVDEDDNDAEVGAGDLDHQDIEWWEEFDDDPVDSS